MKPFGGAAIVNCFKWQVRGRACSLLVSVHVSGVIDAIMFNPPFTAPAANSLTKGLVSVRKVVESY